MFLLQCYLCLKLTSNIFGLRPNCVCCLRHSKLIRAKQPDLKYPWHQTNPQCVSPQSPRTPCWGSGLSGCAGTPSLSSVSAWFIQYEWWSQFSLRTADLLRGVVHLGERGPAAAPGLAQPDRPVLYGGVVHRTQTPHLTCHEVIMCYKCYMVSTSHTTSSVDMVDTGAGRSLTLTKSGSWIHSLCNRSLTEFLFSKICVFS